MIQVFRIEEWYEWFVISFYVKHFANEVSAELLAGPSCGQRLFFYLGIMLLRLRKGP